MSQRNNDIEKVGTTSNYNYYSNDNERRYAKSRRVEEIADTLMKRLNLSDGSRPFMCKVAWRLPEATIWRNMETALKSDRNPAGLFIFLCKRDGV